MIGNLEPRNKLHQLAKTAFHVVIEKNHKVSYQCFISIMMEKQTKKSHNL